MTGRSEATDLSGLHVSQVPHENISLLQLLVLECEIWWWRLIKLILCAMPKIELLIYIIQTRGINVNLFRTSGHGQSSEPVGPIIPLLGSKSDHKPSDKAWRCGWQRERQGDRITCHLPRDSSSSCFWDHSYILYYIFLSFPQFPQFFSNYFPHSLHSLSSQNWMHFRSSCCIPLGSGGRKCVTQLQNRRCMAGFRHPTCEFHGISTVQRRSVFRIRHSAVHIDNVYSL